VRNGVVYVATHTGTLRARAASDGSQTWTAGITGSGSVIVADPLAEERIAGGKNSLVLVGDTAGIMHALTDTGPSFTPAWTYTPAGGAKVISAPAISNLAGKVYVGQNNGELHQLNLVNGTDEQHTAAGAITDNVFDPALDVSTVAVSDLDRMKIATTSTTNNFKSYCIPWPTIGGPGTMSLGAGDPSPDGVPGPAPSPQGISCGGTTCPNNTACTTWTCNVNTNTCEPQNIPNGTACDDKNTCTCDNPVATCTSPCGFFCCGYKLTCPGGADGHCSSGVCVNNHADDSCNSQNCTAPGQGGVCPSSYGLFTGLRDKYCCGGGVCVDILNDNTNCGQCGHVCSTSRFGPGTPTNVDKCVGGICERDWAGWCSNQPPDEYTLNNDAAQLTGAAAISFPTLLEPGTVACNVGLATYNTSGNAPACLLGSPAYNNSLFLADSTTGKLNQYEAPICVFNLFGGTPGELQPFTNVAVASYGNGIAGGWVNDPSDTNPADTGMFIADATAPLNYVNNYSFDSNLNGWSTKVTGAETVTDVSAGCRTPNCAQVGNSIGGAGCSGSYDAEMWQNFTVPSEPAFSNQAGYYTLLAFYKPFSKEGNPNVTTYDYFEILLRNSTGTTTLATLLSKTLSNSQTTAVAVIRAGC
jgi:hypothetical protein